MATPKKDPSEHSKRGRKETIIDNSDLRSALAGIKYLNQLTAEAHNVLKAVQKEFKLETRNKAYDTKKILFLLRDIRYISKDDVKNLLDKADYMNGSEDYKDTSVDNYKAVLKKANSELMNILKTGQIRVDLHTDEACQKLNGAEAFELQRMLDNNADYDDMIEMLMKIKAKREEDNNIDKAA